MKFLCKCIVVVLALCAVRFSFAEPKLQNESDSLFVRVFYGVFFNATQVLEAYSGSWSGSQTISTDGRVVASALVEQKYIPVTSDSKRLIGSGKISGMGSVIPTRSVMFVDEFGNLRLDIRTQNDQDVPYIGVIDGATVVWVPLHFMYLYDSQTDEFVNTSEGMSIRSKGLKFVSIPQSGFEGYIELNCNIRRNKSAYSVDKVKSSYNEKIVFPKNKLSD